MKRTSRTFGIVLLAIVIAAAATGLQAKKRAAAPQAPPAPTSQPAEPAPVAAPGEPGVLRAADVLDVKGNGPDGKGNTDDDAWGFWMQYDHRGGYLRMMERKVSPSGVPDGANVAGWVYSNTPSTNRHGKTFAASDWSPEYEGIWGNKANGQIHLHPYTHHGLHAGLAITYKIPADGKYNISGTITDCTVIKKAPMDGVFWVVEVVANGTEGTGKLLGKGQPIGDTNEKDSDTISVKNAELKKGQLVRLLIDPNKWWGTDMTRLEGYKIVSADAPKAAPAK